MRRNLVWVFLSACAWMFLGIAVRSVAYLPLRPLQTLAEGNDSWWSYLYLWPGFLISGVAAYALIRLIRGVGAPRAAWLGVLVLQAVGFAWSARGHWIPSPGEDFWAIPLLYLPAALLPVLGAWLGSRGPERGAVVSKEMPVAPESQ
jgi:hypothetical protein